MSLDAAAPQRAQYQVQADAGYHGMAPLPTGDSTDPTALTNTMFADYPLKGIAHPHPHDVLCGRGGQSNSHPGNAQWRMLVAANKELYVSLPKKQKMLLSQSIVNAVRSQNPPGRFLQKDGNNSSWYDVGDKRAQEKTSQALREGAPEIRTKLHTTPLTSPNPGAAVTAVGSSSSPIGLNSSEHGENEGSGEVVPPVVSEPTIDRSSSQHLPPKLVEVTSSASVGSSATQPTGNQSKQPQLVSQQSSSHAYNHRNPLPYTANDVSTAYNHPYHPPTQHVYPGCPPPHHLLPTPLDYAHVPTMAPPSVIPQIPIPPQGPIPERKSKKHQQQPPKTCLDQTGKVAPKNGDSAATEIAEIDELYVPTIRDDKYSQSQNSGHPVTSEHYSNIAKLSQQSKLPPNENSYDNSFDETPIAPPAFDGNGEFSFGSTLMISDIEQARLMNGCSFGTAMSYGYSGNQQQDNNRPIPASSAFRSINRDQSIESDTPLPVDGGLEPVGLSFGSMMSTGTGLPIGESVRLEGAGLSFGSMMSYAYTPQSNVGVGARTNTVAPGPRSVVPSAVDGGLEDIGTSMGSLTLDPEERQRIIESAKNDMMNGLGDNPEMPPPAFHARKSKSNLLECSDSEDSGDEAESKSEQLSAQKSLGWERMQAALAAHTSTSGVSVSNEKYSTTNNSNSYSQIPHFAQVDSRSFVTKNVTPHIVAPATLNIPTTSFSRDFSQMSAISVNDEDYREHELDHSSFQYDPQSMADYSGNKSSTYHGQERHSQYTYPQQEQYEEQASWYEPEPYPYHQQQYVVPNSSGQNDASRRQRNESYSHGYDNTTHAMMPPPPAQEQMPPSSNSTRQEERFKWNQHNHHDRNYQAY